MTTDVPLELVTKGVSAIWAVIASVGAVATSIIGWLGAKLYANLIKRVDKNEAKLEALAELQREFVKRESFEKHKDQVAEQMQKLNNNLHVLIGEFKQSKVTSTRK